MNLKLSKAVVTSNTTIGISGSKSETNRLLLLQAQFPEIIIKNFSNSDDSRAMKNALVSEASVLDVGHAGTAMRFLTAYFACQPGKEITLTGSQRMQLRPIAILVDALRNLGAKIDYIKDSGFPPIRIIGQDIVKNEISINADVSSQYISALLLIAPSLRNGLKLSLQGKITSWPYIQMTISLLQKLGVDVNMFNQIIEVKSIKPQDIAKKIITVESDWSSASYFYSIVALSPIGTTISLSNFYSESLQGDRFVAEIYHEFGVETRFENGTITISKVNSHINEVKLNLINCPDLAQTIAVTCVGLGCRAVLGGLKTLKIKETDRLIALKNELSKLGAQVIITDDSLQIFETSDIASNIRISTYDDHRMAMAFAPLAIKTDIIIENAEVVSKSYPEFWNDLKRIGYNFTPIE